MKQKRILPAVTESATSLALPEQLAQQAADAVRELLAEAAAANTTRSYAAACATGPAGTRPASASN